MQTRKLRLAPLLHRAWIFSVAFNRDGTIALTGSKDKTARLWDTTTGMQLGPTIPHPAGILNVLTVAFSPDGNHFLTGGVGHGARLFRRPELPDDLDRVATWTEILTGMTLEPQRGTIQVLDNTAWRRRQEQLEKRGGPPETRDGTRFDPFQLDNDPIARGLTLMARRRWAEAEAAFDEVVPRGRTTLRAGSRVVDFESPAATPGGPPPTSPRRSGSSRRIWGLRYLLALSLLFRETAGVRVACSDMVRQLGPSGGLLTIDSVAWSCVLGPGSVADPRVPVRLAESR